MNDAVSNNDMLKEILDHPEVIGREVGFRDLLPIHGEWIREMVFGQEDHQPGHSLAQGRRVYVDAQHSPV